MRPYHARQIEKSSIVKNELNLYFGEKKVFRIGDSLNEQLKIPKDYKERIISVEKYCTKPELEMLLIIAEGMIDAIDKVKSSVKAKNFAKQNIRCGRKKYDNSSEFYENYFGSNVELLVESIKEYKRVKGKHSKDEGYLANMIVASRYIMNFIMDTLLIGVALVMACILGVKISFSLTSFFLAMGIIYDGIYFIFYYKWGSNVAQYTFLGFVAFGAILYFAIRRFNMIDVMILENINIKEVLLIIGSAVYIFSGYISCSIVAKRHY